jgi:hypothetical protein
MTLSNTNAPASSCSPSLEALRAVDETDLRADGSHRLVDAVVEDFVEASDALSG